MPDYRTTHPGAMAGLPSLRSGVSCVLRAAVICVVACISLLMIPVNVYVNFSGLYIDGNHAFADDEVTPPLPEPPRPSGPALTYLDMLANQAQLDTSQFVATTICAMSASTGMVMAANPGIKMFDGNLYDNLDALVDAADYPAWDTLTYEEQMQYGNKQDYDATKYLSLMDAFDLGSGYTRYQDSLSSGGSDFSFNEGETSVLQKLGRIGSNWAKGIGNTFESVKDCLAPDYDEIMFEFLYGKSSGESAELQYKGEGIDGWTGGTIYYKLTNIAWRKHYAGGDWYNITRSISDVYFILAVDANNSKVVDVFLFSLAPFSYGSAGTANPESNITLNRNATEVTRVEGKPYYYGNTTFAIVDGTSPTFSQTVNPSSAYITYECMANILYGGGSSGGDSGELVPDIPDYPANDEVPANQTVYYPPDGISPQTTWNQYITVQRPENPFNPDNETSTPEWKQETKQNIQGLQGVHFEKLFPFCLYYDLDKFWKKVQRICGISTDENGQLTTQDNNSYNEINLRMYVPNVMDEVWTFNLEPLRDLLLITKPFMLVFLICVEIVSMIMLWKGILTGS